MLTQKVVMILKNFFKYYDKKKKEIKKKYYDIEEMYNIEIPHENKSLSLFNINACFLDKTFDDL